MSNSDFLRSLDIEELVKGVRNLSHLGVENNNIELPKICVVGDQSTGKSSLIESISGIKVPRSTGTCTRCPMEINLSACEPDEEWRCSVYLSPRYRYDSKSRIKSPRKGLGPWIEWGDHQPDELFETLTAHEKYKVEDAIKWAQVAILNPGKNPNKYKLGKNIDFDDSVEVKFSPNAVRLDVSGPDFPSLSFYDLPGVINQPEQDDEKYLVQLVENLVKHYVSQENCIVLLTLTMTDDPTNSSASRLIRGIKNAPERTLGVLTKPDKVDTRESFCQWEDLLNGSKFKLGRGYYVVLNNPNPAVDTTQARAEEAKFFSGSLWGNYLKSYQSRFGVHNLVEAVSKILKAQIQTCLPSIIDQINEEARRIDRELATLPRPPEYNVQGVVIKKTIQLGVRIENIFGGDSAGMNFQRTMNELMADFETALRYTRPRMKTSGQLDEQQFKEKINQDSELIFTPPTPRKKRPAPPENDSTQSSPSLKVKVETTNKPSNGAIYKTTAFENMCVEGYLFTLEDVHEIRQNSQSGGIPSNVDAKAYELMAKRSVLHWEKIANIFVNALHEHVENVLTEALGEELTQYKQTGLYRELSTIIQQHIDYVRAEQLQNVRHFYEIQHGRPFTRAQEEFKFESEKALKSLEQSRAVSRAKLWLRLNGQPAEDNNQVRSVIAGDSNSMGVDPYSQEVKMVAASRGYYEIARTRFLDVVCQMVEYRIRFRCRDELAVTLRDGYTEQSSERCAELMAEDPQREALRNRLQKKRDSLTEAQNWLANFPGIGSGQNNDSDDLTDLTEMTIDEDFSPDMKVVEIN